MRALLAAAACFLATALAGCSVSEDMKAADDAVVRFHAQLDAGQIDEIYAGAADELKKLEKRAEFVQVLNAVHNKLGATQASTKSNWSVNYHTSGNFITLVHATQYARGEATEQFLFRVQDHKALLAGYNVNSRALLLDGQPQGIEVKA
jgi:hypothetical protein